VSLKTDEKERTEDGAHKHEVIHKNVKIRLHTYGKSILPSSNVNSLTDVYNIHNTHFFL
jgi:hypothetical protein